jgi:hypothetical protein
MQSLSARVVTGRTIVERFHGLTVPAELQPFVTGFEEQHTKYSDAYDESLKAETRRDQALVAVGKADSELDASLEDLAIGLVSARLGERRKPFARFSALTMSQIVVLAYAKEVEEVERIAAKIKEANPPEPVVTTVAQCLQHAANVKTALSALSVPDAEYTRKLAARDALVADWERAYAKLERRAQVVWEDEPGTLMSVFARPDSVQQPVTRRKKKKAASRA